VACVALRGSRRAPWPRRSVASSLRGLVAPWPLSGPTRRACPAFAHGVNYAVNCGVVPGFAAQMCPASGLFTLQAGVALCAISLSVSASLCRSVFNIAYRGPLCIDIFGLLTVLYSTKRRLWCGSGSAPTAPARRITPHLLSISECYKRAACVCGHARGGVFSLAHVDKLSVAALDVGLHSTRQ